MAEPPGNAIETAGATWRTGVLAASIRRFCTVATLADGTMLEVFFECNWSNGWITGVESTCVRKMGRGIGGLSNSRYPSAAEPYGADP